MTSKLLSSRAKPRDPVRTAALCDVTQPRASDLMRGKIILFGLDVLVNMATAAGLQIEMRVIEAAA